MMTAWLYWCGQCSGATLISDVQTRKAETDCRSWSCVFAVLVLGLCAGAEASNLFVDDAVLEIELAGPIGELIGHRADKLEYPFVLRANDVEISVQVRARGNSRLRLCHFPPLRLNFEGQDVAGTVFADQGRVKLVSHCREAPNYESYLLDEYAAYRIFNVISDNSYRVRLARVTYVDTAEDADPRTIERFAFLIESADDLAQRIGAQHVEVPGIAIGSLDEAQAAEVFVYQYLIGNTDWSLVTADSDDFCCHNIDLYQADDRHIIVPFDFDLSGLVDARYAKPDPSLRLSRVTQRRYRGYCISPNAVATALGSINAKQEDVVSALRETPGLSDEAREKALEFLAGFFRHAADKEDLLRRFERGCL